MSLMRATATRARQRALFYDTLLMPPAYAAAYYLRMAIMCFRYYFSHAYAALRCYLRIL